MHLLTSTSLRPNILWDLNGVLLDDEPVHEQCFRELLVSDFGIELSSVDYDNYFLGKTDRLGFIDFFSQVESSIGEKMLDVMCAKKHRLYEHYALKGLNINLEAVTMLDDLSSHNYKQTLVTCDQQSDVVKILQKNLPNVFDVIITSNDVKYSKPSSEPYLQAMAKLGVSDKSCIVIEDTLAGAISGKSAGAQVAVIHSKNDTNFLRELYDNGLDDIFMTYDEIRIAYNL
jgi:HAD superfamily hydrolase (TIGR01509 family)